jgi:hypothetical protein
LPFRRVQLSSGMQTWQSTINMIVACTGLNATNHSFNTVDSEIRRRGQQCGIPGETLFVRRDIGTPSPFWQSSRPLKQNELSPHIRTRLRNPLGFALLVSLCVVCRCLLLQNPVLHLNFCCSLRKVRQSLRIPMSEPPDEPRSVRRSCHGWSIQSGYVQQM